MCIRDRVSSVGRSLGSAAGEFILSHYAEELSEESRNFYAHNLHNVIAAACLCHDVGNPAFGHSGEAVSYTHLDVYKRQHPTRMLR